MKKIIVETVVATDHDIANKCKELGDRGFVLGHTEVISGGRNWMYFYKDNQEEIIQKIEDLTKTITNGISRLASSNNIRTIDELP
jgi:hypothetical protein